METVRQETYRDWTISISAKQKHCSNFSFTITDQTGQSQYVAMGGDNEQRALERARERIDLEIEYIEG